MKLILGERSSCLSLGPIQMTEKWLITEGMRIALEGRDLSTSQN